MQMEGSWYNTLVIAFMSKKLHCAKKKLNYK